ncbi:MAG: hypothetical protein AB1921_14580 [Thermodesulfobacteriota bacterium]
MAFGDVRLCPSCGKLYVEDERMQLDVNVCPNCGAEIWDPPARDEEG